MEAILSLVQTAGEYGLCCALTVMALFLSYSMLNVCDLSTDGCFTLGAVVGATVALAGYPHLSLIAAMAAGMASGFVTAILQTKMGVDSLLSGIVVNTGLYSVNMAILGGKSNANLFKVTTVFTELEDALKGTVLYGISDLMIMAIAVLLVGIFLVFFLRTRLGLAIRATGNNPEMVRSSSINPGFTTIVGLVIANSFTALSGCLMGQMAKSVDMNSIGAGILTMALASLLIGRTFFRKCRIPLQIVGTVVGAFLFRLFYAIALRVTPQAYLLKLWSSVIVVLAICIPYFKNKYPEYVQRFKIRQKNKRG